VPEPKVYARRLVKGSAIVFTALVASGFMAFLSRLWVKVVEGKRLAGLAGQGAFLFTRTRL
jgi:hypothetical protein